jgi:hypothetical protein
LVQASKAVQRSFAQACKESRAVDTRIKTLLLEEQLVKLENQGEPLLQAMQQAEQLVVTKWGKLQWSLDAATGMYSLGILTRFPTEAYLAAAEPTKAKNKSDVWLAELAYRSALQQEVDCWNQHLSQLSQLLAAARTAECERRLGLQSLLQELSMNQATIWAAVEATQKEPLVEWIEASSERAAMEQAIAAELQSKAEDGKKSLADRLSTLQFYEELYAGTALDSEYCKLSCIVEWNGDVPALLVITTDHNLHLFALPSIMQPEQALAVLEPLVPTRTVALSDLQVNLSEQDNVLEFQTAPSPISIKALTPRDQVAILNAIHGVESRVTL